MADKEGGRTKWKICNKNDSKQRAGRNDCIWEDKEDRK